MTTRRKKVKKIIGWREWCVLPGLGIPAIKAKSDTGATTSALHAIHISPFRKRGKEYVRFKTHPIQQDWNTFIECEALLVDQFHVKSSVGHKEERHVISTPIILDGEKWDIKLTLTSRETMGFRMLLGREAMKSRLIVDPQLSYQFGNKTNNEVRKLYKLKKILGKF